MHTTLNKIREKLPCKSGWNKLLNSLNKIEADDEPLDLMYILKSNGTEDAIWALRCFDYKDYCLFLADVAESVLDIFEAEYPNDNRPRKAIQAIRDYEAGIITEKELQRTAADAAACAAAAAAACAAYAAYADAAAAADAAAYAADADAEKWQEIEKLFIKHFGNN